MGTLLYFRDIDGMLPCTEGSPALILLVYYCFWGLSIIDGLFPTERTILIPFYYVVNMFLLPF